MDFKLIFHAIQVVYLFQSHGYVINKEAKVEDNVQELYLEKFGYLKNSEYSADNRDGILHEALVDFQHTWSLPVTGEVNRETLELMQKPRCGNDDLEITQGIGKEQKHRRQKRFSILPYGGWRKNNLTYRVKNRPLDLTGSQVLSAIDHAFMAWAKITPLTFRRVHSNPDIDILFASYDHGDGSFDGLGGTVAHTYYPAFGGDIHLDASEKWTLGLGQGTDLFQTAVHEIGHALGLGHTRSHTAVMYPYYQFMFPWKLGKDDIGGIQFLYGNPDSASPTSYLDFCAKPAVDAATTNSRGDVFIFGHLVDLVVSALISQTSEDSWIESLLLPPCGTAFPGKYFMKVDNEGIADGYPRLINEGMPELTNNIDASVHLPPLYAPSCRHSRFGSRKCTMIEERRTYMFKGDIFYLYNEKDTYKDKGKMSEEFPSMPSSIDAAFTIDGSHIYFVKGKKYWRMERGKPIRGVDPGYPRILSEDFRGLPDNIDAVVRSEVKTVRKFKNIYILFFFSGSKYYRITNFRFKVGESIRLSPRTIGPDWFNCPTSGAMTGANRNKWKKRQARKLSDR